MQSANAELDNFWQKFSPPPSPEGVFDCRHHYSLSPAQGEINGVEITKLGRFANSLIQVANAIEMAERMGWRYVYLRPIELLNRREPISIPNGIQVVPYECNDRANVKLLKGPFFATADFGKFFDDFTVADQRRILRATILPHLDLLATPRCSTELAIHIRSGDVFSANPHPGYPQPPLAFYRKVIRQLEKEGAIDRICIVYENDENPCVNGLIEHLAEVNIPYRLQSGSLQDDISELLGARHVVFGLGTFGRGICYLSDQIESVFSWNTPGYRSFAHLRRLWGGRPAMDYPIRGEWTASLKQRAQMLNYPDDHVAIDKIYEPDRTTALDFSTPSARAQAPEATLKVFGYLSDTGFDFAQRLASAGIPAQLCASVDVLQEEAQSSDGSRIVVAFCSLPDTIAIEIAYRPLKDIHANWLEFANLILKIHEAAPGRVIVVNPANTPISLADALGVSPSKICLSFVSGPDVHRLLGERELHRDPAAIAASRKLEKNFPDWKTEIDAEELAWAIENLVQRSTQAVGRFKANRNRLKKRFLDNLIREKSISAAQRKTLKQIKSKQAATHKRTYFLFTNPFLNFLANLDYRAHKAASKFSLLSNARRSSLRKAAKKRRDRWISPR